MPKFDVWFNLSEHYVVTVEADSYEQAMDMVYENPESDFESRSWLDADVNIEHWQEVQND